MYLFLYIEMSKYMIIYIYIHMFLPLNLYKNISELSLAGKKMVGFLAGWHRSFARAWPWLSHSLSELRTSQRLLETESTFGLPSSWHGRCQ